MKATIAEFPKCIRVALISVVCFLSVILLTFYVFNSYNNRLALDDFNTLIGIRDYGLLRFQMNNYLDWSGRYSSTFFISLFSILAAWTHKGSLLIFSIITFNLLIISYYFLLKSYAMDCRYSMAAYITPVLAASLLYTTPDTKEAVYWLSGTITYLWPFFFLVLQRIISDSKLVNYKKYIISGLLAAIIASSNETYGAFYLILQATEIILNKLKIVADHRDTQYRVFIALISLISFMLMYLSPGNSVRAGMFDQMSLISAIYASIENGINVLYQYFLPYTLFYISLLVFLAFVISNYDFKIISIRKLLFHLAMISSFILFFSFPSFVSIGIKPPTRLVIAISLFIITAIIEISVYISQNLKLNKLFFLASSLLMTVFLYERIIDFKSGIGIDRKYSQRYDALYAELDRAHKDEDIKFSQDMSTYIVPSLGITSVPGSWVNKSVARYFEVSSVRLDR